MRNLIGYLAIAVVLFQVFIAKPDPVIIPPKPDDDVVIVVPPDDVVVPVEKGKRTIAIIYNAEDVTTDFTTTINALRQDTEEKTDEFADYIEDKGHTLYVLDDETTDAEDERAQFISDLLSVDSDLPHIYIMESSDGRPLDNEEIDYDVTVAEIKAFIVQNGG